MKNETRLYSIWRHMLDRCRNPNNDSWMYYGGSGIAVCSEWKKFKLFEAWALNNGYKDNLTIDRIDVNGNYEPSNCRWADMKTQNNNRRNSRYLEYNGERHTIAEWAVLLNVPYKRIYRRIELGYPISAALGFDFFKNKTSIRKAVN